MTQSLKPVLRLIARVLFSVWYSDEPFVWILTSLVFFVPAWLCVEGGRDQVGCVLATLGFTFYAWMYCRYPENRDRSFRRRWGLDRERRTQEGLTVEENELDGDASACAREGESE